MFYTFIISIFNFKVKKFLDKIKKKERGGICAIAQIVIKICGKRRGDLSL